MQSGSSSAEASVAPAGLSLYARHAEPMAGPRARYDVCVIGGGPAGLAAAIAVVQRGMTAVVVDGMTPPVEKACGEGLMPDTLAALGELGITLNNTFDAPDNTVSSASVCGIRFIEEATKANAGANDKTIAEAHFSGHSGRGVRRLHLHQALLDRATQLGVAFRWQTVVQGTTDTPGEALVATNRGDIRADYVVGADGQASRVREWAGLARASVTAKRIALRQHFAVAPWTNFVEVYWSDHGQAYVTPVSGDEVCVAFVSQQRFAGVADALAHFPELQIRLQTATASDTPRGAVTFSRTLRRVTRGRVALVGDASGSVDAITGEGLSLCFRQALALASAIESSSLASYEQAHRSMRRLPHLMAAVLLQMDRHAWLRRRSIQMLAAHPELFRSLLAAHTGSQPLPLFGRSGMLATGFELGVHLLIA